MTKLIKAKVLDDIVSELNGFNVIDKPEEEALTGVSKWIDIAEPHDKSRKRCRISQNSSSQHEQKHWHHHLRAS